MDKLYDETKGPREFDPIWYRAKYNDLPAEMTDRDLLRHWLLHGEEEKRFPNFCFVLMTQGVVPPFNWPEYIMYVAAQTPSVVLMSKAEAVEHYITTEPRTFSQDGLIS